MKLKPEHGPSSNVWVKGAAQADLFIKLRTISFHPTQRDFVWSVLGNVESSQVSANLSKFACLFDVQVYVTYPFSSFICAVHFLEGKGQSHFDETQISWKQASGLKVLPYFYSPFEVRTFIFSEDVPWKYYWFHFHFFVIFFSVSPAHYF